MRPPARLCRAAPLGARTTLGVGGPAAYMLTARRLRTVLGALRWARARRLQVLPVGAGSNLLVADGGYPGLVLRLADRRVRATGDGLWAAAGASWETVVDTACDRGLAGIECLAGIPGTAGAAPVQNIGAYGQALAQVLVGVLAVAPGAAGASWLPLADCQLGYRQSRFRREPGWLVLAVRLRLAAGRAAACEHRELVARLGTQRRPPAMVAAAVRAVRAGKGMLWPPRPATPAAPGTAGSFFLNPVVDHRRAAALAARFGGQLPMWPLPDGVRLSAAWLIERAGYGRGLRAGAVGLSDAHALALVNRGGARAADLVALAGRIREAVAATFAVSLALEVRPVGLGPAARLALGLAD